MYRLQKKKWQEKNMADILVGNNKKKDIAQILEEYFAVKRRRTEGSVSF